MSDIQKRFNGIAVSEFEDKTYNLIIDDETVIINQSFYTNGKHCKILEFKFDLIKPVRFRIDVLLPESIVNACVTLNSNVLIGLFSKILPDDCEVIAPSTCGDNHEVEKYSTLIPGKFQSINFKWITTDVLKFYLFYA